MPTPIDDVRSDLEAVFSGPNLFYFVAMGWSTYVMVLSGADRVVHDVFDRHIDMKTGNSLANVGGYLVPGLVTPSIWVVGLLTHDRTLAGAGSAVIESILVTVTTMGALKFATGRVWPRDGNLVDYSKDFDPFRNGTAAWPSGHAATTTTITAALTAYYPEHWWIPAIGYPLAAYLGIGMVDRNSHWASDLVSGMLLGQAVGYSIGRNFRRRVRGIAGTADSLIVAPLPEAAGLSLSGTW
ncbi:MAG: phosphatase PAP2 family protein [Kofleriaceae bacterium]|nr:phosphatase PAP2 family protein [Kofleriaceae bacterium]